MQGSRDAPDTTLIVTSRGFATLLYHSREKHYVSTRPCDIHFSRVFKFHNILGKSHNTSVLVARGSTLRELVIVLGRCSTLGYSQ